MKKYRSLFLVSVLLMVLYLSTAAVSAETTYTWRQCGYSISGSQEDGMQIMHTLIDQTHADGEQNYADVYCALEIPPESFPADKELSLKFKLYGDVRRNDNNRGIYVSCDVVVAEPDLSWEETLNAGNSMLPDNYNAMSWGNNTPGGFSDRETVVSRYMSRSSYSEGDIISIYLRTNFGQCEWKYKLEKHESGSEDGVISGSDVDYVIKGKLVYEVKNNQASFFYRKNENLTKIIVPATIKYKGKKIPVTGISWEAFKGMKKLKTVIIGKNVSKIGKKAFYNCPKLKNITIKTTKLTTKKIGANAFKGINKKAIVKCPKAKKKAYKKMLLKKGMKKTVKFRNL